MLTLSMKQNKVSMLCKKACPSICDPIRSNRKYFQKNYEAFLKRLTHIQVVSFALISGFL